MIYDILQLSQKELVTVPVNIRERRFDSNNESRNIYRLVPITSAPGISKNPWILVGNLQEWTQWNWAIKNKSYIMTYFILSDDQIVLLEINPAYSSTMDDRNIVVNMAFNQMLEPPVAVVHVNEVYPNDTRLPSPGTGEEWCSALYMTLYHSGGGREMWTAIISDDRKVLGTWEVLGGQAAEQSMTPREHMLLRIKNLFNKSIDNGCTLEETESAHALAARLMTKYQFGLKDLQESVL